MFLAFVLDSLVFHWLFQHVLLLALQDLEATSIIKSRFLWEEHGRMEWEAMMSRWVDELEP